MSASLLPAVLCFALLACAIVAIACCCIAGSYDNALEELDGHAQLADDIHLAKVARMAEMMKEGREEAFAKYLQSPADGLPIVPRGKA
jgi:hypothetical protein